MTNAGPQRGTGADSTATKSEITVTRQSLDIEIPPWRPTIRGRVVVDLALHVDDQGFMADAARSALTWPTTTPDGVDLLVLLGRARWFTPWFWEILLDGPRWG